MKKGRIRIRFEKREKLPTPVRIAIPLCSILLALAVCAVLLYALGYDAFKAYGKMLKGSMGSMKNISESLLQAIPLMLCGLGVSISFKMSVNNIGAEGQFVMGAWAITGIALFSPWVSQQLMLPTMFVAAFLAGAFWAVLAILPRALWGVSETIISLMLNYVALFWLDYWCYGAWRNAEGTNLPFTKSFPAYARLTPVFNRVHTGVIIAIVAAVLIYLFFKHTSRGYQIRVIGTNPKVARYAGMDVRKNLILVMAFSGGLAGLAGLAQVSGTTGLLQPDVANGAGYTAITIAYLSKFNPFTVLIVSFLFGCMTQGGFSIQLMNISTQVVTLIQGAILFAVLGGEIFSRNRLLIYRESLEEVEKR